MSAGLLHLICAKSEKSWKDRYLAIFRLASTVNWPIIAMFAVPPQGSLVRGSRGFLTTISIKTIGVISMKVTATLLLVAMTTLAACATQPEPEPVVVAEPTYDKMGNPM